MDLVLELALHVTLREVAEPLFFRRFHAQATSQQDQRALWQYYFPGSRMGKSYERKYMERLRAISSSSLSWRDKGRAF